MLIYYIKTILILYLTNICVLINILIAKKSKILFAIFCYVYNMSILSLYIASSFLNKFIFVNNKNQCNYFFIYIKIMLSVYLINTIVAKTIAIFTTKKDKD